MKLQKLFFLLLVFSVTLVNAQEKLSIFYKTAGFKHESIPTGIAALEEIAEENNWTISATDDAEKFVSELSNIDAVIFLSTTGDVFTEDQQEKFRKYIDNGGNFFGIHAASDTEYDWPWYGKFIGAYFESHPHIQEAEVVVEMQDHPTVAHLPKVWKRTDEWYNFKNINPNLQVLLQLNETSYEGGKNGEFHPHAWFQEFEDGGKMIYTGGGHTAASYNEPLFREHLVKCIQFLLK
ncbi:ThuA domain-containing protein [Zunongwangia atlantica]|uniref:Class I glutamine amidotransferase-like protein n=1 Tax=Zunongwangia atlantica 22II14-10F7 TaxID=1185767 RepID=A0A1Y1T285_9FLAO|nr:ThuA domain-containing protein [Zunongwangia atlantica]ORL45138.1 class I glutamine amidotransferase-like protein [Zunongwangia atlantica 22II14-10F7]